MSFHRSQTPQSQNFGNFSRINRNIYPNYNAGQSNSQMDMGGPVKQVNPFLTNPHGHPAFNPIKINNKSVGDSSKGIGGKQPKPPDKPLMPYMRYSRKVSRLVWDSVKANNPDLKLWEIGKVIGQMWRDLSEDQKQEYVDEYEAEKVQYMDALKVYHNSPAYLSWVASKGKDGGEVDVDEGDKGSRRNKSMREVTDQRIISTMQANEEEDDLEDSYSTKNISAARYHRNHCLINEVFSDALVPDGRTVINEPRMVVLKRQVQSLTMHQKKLENELQLIEDRHVSKKARFHEGSSSFYAELAKLCESKPRISEEQFEQMVFKAKDELNNKNNNNENNNNNDNNKIDNDSDNNKIDNSDISDDKMKDKVEEVKEDREKEEEEEDGEKEEEEEMKEKEKQESENEESNSYKEVKEQEIEDTKEREDIEKEKINEEIKETHKDTHVLRADKLQDEDEDEEEDEEGMEHGGEDKEFDNEIDNENNKDVQNNKEKDDEEEEVDERDKREVVMEKKRLEVAHAGQDKEESKSEDTNVKRKDGVDGAQMDDEEADRTLQSPQTP